MHNIMAGEAVHTRVASRRRKLLTGAAALGLLVGLTLAPSSLAQAEQVRSSGQPSSAQPSAGQGVESSSGTAARSHFVSSAAEALRSAGTTDVSPGTQPGGQAPAVGSRDVGVAAGKRMPLISVARGSKWPYNAVIPLTLTVDGAPLNGQVTLGVAVTTPGGSRIDSDQIDLVDGQAFYVFMSEDGDPIGQTVTMRFFVEEDDNFLSSSTSTRTYELVDLPAPVLTFRPDPIIRHVGAFKVGITVPYVPEEAMPDVCVRLDLGDFKFTTNVTWGTTLCGEPQNGMVSLDYDISMFRKAPPVITSYTARTEALTFDTDFTNASSLPYRYSTTSAEWPISYALPATKTLRRSGTLVIPTSTPGPETDMDNPFYLDVVVDGRSFRFVGRYGYWQTQPSSRPVPGVRFEYSLPQSAVNKSARVVMSNPLGLKYSAASSSPRSYQIVK